MHIGIREVISAVCWMNTWRGNEEKEVAVEVSIQDGLVVEITRIALNMISVE